ncbi:MAG: ribose 5-phosphate isomerase B [Ruminococcaceae bacterium]|nr:ribose 5-phosphate isomerase B [Oscillospiraceae bacterium]
MKIAIACDHGALRLKEELIPYLRKLGHSVEDFGTNSYESCDYSDFAIPAAKAVAKGKCDRGIVLCTTGIGVSIAANKVRGIRCALLSDVECAEMTRLHNDTNVMAMGAAVVSTELAYEIVKVWLETPFSGEPRHQRRIRKVMECETDEKKKRVRRVKKKQTKRRRRRKPFRAVRKVGGWIGSLYDNLIGKTVNGLLSVLLVIALLLTPIATFVTNMADPEALVNMLFDSDVFQDESATEATTEDPNATEPGVTEPETTEPGVTEPETTEPETTEPGTTEPETTDPANAPATIDESDATEPEVTEPDATEPEVTEPESTEPTPTEPEATEPDHAGETSDAVDALLGIMGGLTGTDIIDTEHLNEYLELPADVNVDVEKLGAGLANSGASKALVSAYMKDVMNAAMGVEGETHLTPDTAMTIIAPHMGELADIVQASLPEGVKLDRAHLEEVMQQALEQALPDLVAGLPDLSSAANALLESDNEIVVAATKSLRFIRTGALRAAVLLVVLALCVLISLVRLPGLRGARTVGVCGIVAGTMCYGITMAVDKLPALITLLPEQFAFVGDLLMKLLTPLTTGLHEAYIVCAVVYAVIGLALVLGTTVLRGFFSAIFGRLFSDD